MKLPRVEVVCELSVDGKVLSWQGEELPAEVRKRYDAVMWRNGEHGGETGGLCVCRVIAGQRGERLTFDASECVEMREVLQCLAERYGVTHVKCEGDGGLVAELVRGGLLASLHIKWKPVIVGGAEVPTLLGPAGIGLLDASVRLRRRAARSDASGWEWMEYRVVEGLGDAGAVRCDAV